MLPRYFFPGTTLCSENTNNFSVENVADFWYQKLAPCNLKNVTFLIFPIL